MGAFVEMAGAYRRGTPQSQGLSAEEGCPHSYTGANTGGLLVCTPPCAVRITSHLLMHQWTVGFGVADLARLSLGLGTVSTGSSPQNMRGPSCWSKKCRCDHFFGRMPAVRLSSVGVGGYATKAKQARYMGTGPVQSKCRRYTRLKDIW